MIGPNEIRVRTFNFSHASFHLTSLSFTQVIIEFLMKISLAMKDDAGKKILSGHPKKAYAKMNFNLKFD